MVVGMKKVLLCPPTYYDIEYEINPWMHTENKVEPLRAEDEYAALKKVYEKLGVEMLEIPPVEGLPDMTYVANAGFPIGNRFIKSNFKYAQRKKEADFAKIYFEKMDFQILTIPEHIPFEGQGDLLTMGGRYFFGWGKRSSREAKDFLDQVLGTKCIDFELRDPYFYHLDMSLGPLDEQTALINPRSFTKEGLFRLKTEFPNFIETSEQDSQVIPCNVVVVDKTVVLGKGISNELQKEIQKRGFTVVQTPMDEYKKGGGSVKCCTLEFF